MLYSTLVSAFTVRASGDRTEAVPLSLFVVLSWEKRLLSRDCPLHEVIVLGGLLLILWGGLRFSDGQRVPLQSLSWSITALRGTCRKTKTTKSGQPWAVQSCGFLSFGSFGWLAKWFNGIGRLMEYTFCSRRPPRFLASNDFWDQIHKATHSDVVFTDFEVVKVFLHYSLASQSVFAHICPTQLYSSLVEIHDIELGVTTCSTGPCDGRAETFARTSPQG